MDFAGLHGQTAAAIFLCSETLGFTIFFMLTSRVAGSKRTNIPKRANANMFPPFRWHVLLLPPYRLSELALSVAAVNRELRVDPAQEPR